MVLDIDAKHDPAHEEHSDGVHNGHHNGHTDTGRRKGGVMNKLYPPGPKPGAGGRIKNHCRRFWWCDLLVLIIVVLVIVLPM
jgi:hypothetical protein